MLIEFICKYLISFIYLFICNYYFIINYREAEDILASQIEKLIRDAKKLDFREKVLFFCFVLF